MDDAMDLDTETLDSIITALAKSQEQPLSILKHQEEHDQGLAKSKNRTSDASDSVNYNPTALAEDLAHYKETFSKLRFSYMEQITKENFLAAIVEDPPQLLEEEDIKEMGKEVAAQKEALRTSKAEVRSIFADIEATGKRICEDYVKVNDLTNRVLQMPRDIEALKAEIASLMYLEQSNTNSPHMHLPLGETLSQLASAENELLQLQRRIDTAKRSIPSKQRKLEALDRELKPLEQNKEGLVGLAEEAIKKREDDRQRGLADRENADRWYRSAEQGLITLVGSEGETT